MYDPALQHGHTDIDWDPDMRISVNEAPITACWFDWESYNDYHWVWLEFDWSHDIQYFFRTWLIKYWLH